METCGLILLAAGSSSRLKQAKQSLPWKDSTLLQHSLQVALAARVDPVILVAGPQTGLVLPAHERLQVVFNHEAREGIASSIRLGLSVLRQRETAPGSVIFMVCDQPFVTPDLLNTLIAAAAAGEVQVATCSYRDTAGTPVLFKKELFDELASLNGDEGAKKLILQHPGPVAYVPFPNGYIDIDTMEDYTALLNSQA